MSAGLRNATIAHRLARAMRSQQPTVAFIPGCAESIDFINSLDGEARVLLPRKSPVPPVREVKHSHVQHEHRVVTPRRTPKNPPRTQFGIALNLFGFHF